MQDLIKTGALVNLKSGSPPMTVVNREGKRVDCVFFNTVTQTFDNVDAPVSVLQLTRPADEDLKIGTPVPLSPVGMYIAFNTEEQRDEFVAEISESQSLQQATSATQH